MARQQKHMKKRNFFTVSNKPVSEMNAFEISNAAERIFRDIAKGAINPSEDYTHFQNTAFVSQLLAKAQTLYSKYSFYANCVMFTVNDAMGKGASISEANTAAVNEINALSAGYSIITYELQCMLQDGDALTHLTRMSQLLFMHRNYF